MEVVEAYLRRANESSVGITGRECGLPNKTQEP